MLNFSSTLKDSDEVNVYVTLHLQAGNPNLQTGSWCQFSGLVHICKWS